MVDSFRGEYAFLSNFFPVNIAGKGTLDGLTFPSVEHAYHAYKCVQLKDAEAIAKHPAKGLKAFARTVLIRPDWNSIKLYTMARLLEQKFKNPDLKDKLLATGSQHLVENNTWGDTYWGVCNGKGFNYLGQLLMFVRSHL